MLRGLLLAMTASALVAACALPSGPVAAPIPGADDGPTPTLQVETTMPTATTNSVTVETTVLPEEVSPLRLMAASAIEDLAGRLGVPVDAVEVIDAAEKEWPDASLGCPAPDFGYTQVLTNGTQLTLQVADQTYDYRGRSPDTMFLCGPKGPVPPGEIP